MAKFIVSNLDRLESAAEFIAAKKNDEKAAIISIKNCL